VSSVEVNLVHLRVKHIQMKLEKKMSEGIGSKVEVFNKDTLETKIYPSNIKAAEALACSESTIRYYLKNSKPFKGKYLFKKIDKV